MKSMSILALNTVTSIIGNKKIKFFKLNFCEIQAKKLCPFLFTYRYLTVCCKLSYANNSFSSTSKSSLSWESLWAKLLATETETSMLGQRFSVSKSDLIKKKQFSIVSKVKLTKNTVSTKNPCLLFYVWAGSSFPPEYVQIRKSMIRVHSFGHIFTKKCEIARTFSLRKRKL
jgi:hypothetical protein